MAPTALLLHGSLDTPATWAGLSSLLPGWTLETPSYAVSTGTDALTQDLPAILTRLAAAPAPILLVGHSYGGLLALTAALAVPERVAGLLLIEPIAFGLLSGAVRERFDVLNVELGRQLASDRAEASLRLLVDYWNGVGTWDRMPERVRERLRDQSARAAIEVESGRRDRTEVGELSRFQRPVQVLWGAQTTAESQQVCGALVAGFPRAHGAAVPGVGHQVSRSAPAAVAAALLALAAEAEEG